tara:strand:+ start:834 stop:1442 length:609 start_codon:yes stop_codon:yes gene_type:complete
MPLIKLNATQALTGALPAVSGASLTGLATDYVKIHSTTMSTAAANVDLNGYFSSTYNAYEVIGMNVKGTNNNEYLAMRVITSGGAQSSNHSSILPGWNVHSSGITTETNYSKGGARFFLFKMAPHQSHMFRLLITFPLKTDEHKCFICHSGGQDYISGADNQSLRISSGRYESDTALTGLRFLTGDDSNLTSGTFTLYGIKN